MTTFDEKWAPVAEKLKWSNTSYPGERKMLEEMIGEDEGILAMVGGMYSADLGQAGINAVKHRGIAVASSKRILFLDKGVFGSSETGEMQYDTVSGISHSTGMFRGGIRIIGRGIAGWQIEMVAKDQIMPFVDAVRVQIDSQSEPEAVARSSDATAVTDELLAEMVQQQTRTNDLLEQLVAKS